jgi:hypothetical protein
MPTHDPRLKAQIRLELFRCAAIGMFPTYEQFRGLFERRKKPEGQFAWAAYFEEIADEERRLGYPDITFVVHHKNNPYPGQIEGNPVVDGKPTSDQLTSLQLGTDRIIELYCPFGTVNPYRVAR